MRVLVLGGTGSIGGAIVEALQERGHEVLALGRSPEARETLRKAGATPIEGDLREPANWIDAVKNVDGIIHAAAVWGDEMEDIDRRLVEMLLQTLRHDDSAKALIYTGGCWFYGETGDVIATEESPFNSIPSFASSIARKLGVETEPVVLDVVSAKTEIEIWAEGYAIDQQMSGQRAIDELGWRPKHLDVFDDIA